MYSDIRLSWLTRNFNALSSRLLVWVFLLLCFSSAHATVVMVLGDSLSAEYGLSRGTGWVALLAQRAPQLKVINASISGDTTAGGLSRLPALIKRHAPGLVIVELGGNDALRGLPLAATRDNLSRMVQTAQGAGAKVLLLGMQVPPNYGPDYAQDFANVFKRVANTHRVAWVPFLLQGIADVPDAARWFQADRIHPNEAAQPKMLDNVWPVLQKLLPQ
jgi:acyl-CoA thioesterase-1